MSNLTQQDYNDACVEFKCLINKMVSDAGQSSIGMAIAMNAIPDLTHALFHFQEAVNPAMESQGVKTLTLSELFGQEITLTVK
ncbi:hypothetical protein NVP1225O_20 [Vibrio phage 1.225.O._10N.261.48.B7]|nr:hypothetical protein NVP1225O_20 [Vibrio phage 1.225.O._10N.261.48.B7]